MQTDGRGPPALLGIGFRGLGYRVKRLGGISLQFYWGSSSKTLKSFECEPGESSRPSTASTATGREEQRAKLGLTRACRHTRGREGGLSGEGRFMRLCMVWKATGLSRSSRCWTSGRFLGVWQGYISFAALGQCGVHSVRWAFQGCIRCRTEFMFRA